MTYYLRSLLIGSVGIVFGEDQVVEYRIFDTVLTKMNHKHALLEKYKIFGSKLRGTAEVESRIQELLHEKETPDNISTLASSLLIEWRCTEENIKNLTVAFSKYNKSAEVRDQTFGDCSEEEFIEDIMLDRDISFSERSGFNMI